MNLERALDLFLQSKSNNLSLDTMRAYKNVSDKLLSIVGELALTRFFWGDYVTFFFESQRDKGVAENTMVQQKGFILSFAAYLRKEKLIDPSMYLIIPEWVRNTSDHTYDTIDLKTFSKIKQQSREHLIKRTYKKKTWSAWVVVYLVTHYVRRPGSLLALNKEAYNPMVGTLTLDEVSEIVLPKSINESMMAIQAEYGYVLDSDTLFVNSRGSAFTDQSLRAWLIRLDISATPSMLYNTALLSLMVNGWDDSLLMRQTGVSKMTIEHFRKAFGMEHEGANHVPRICLDEIKI